MVKPSTTVRVDPVLALRGAACLIVILDHVHRVQGWLVINGYHFSYLFNPSGIMAVQIFYLISGFSVGMGFFSKRYTLTLSSLKSFYTNRLLRIVPAYYICLILSIILYYRHAAISVYDFLRFFTFTANFDYFSLPFQQLLVIISTEMQFYLVAPLLYAGLAFMVKKMHPVAAGIFILFSGFAVRYILLSAGFVSGFVPFALNVYVTVWGMIDYFVFGMFLSYIVVNYSKNIIALNTRFVRFVYPILLLGWFFWTNYIDIILQSWQNEANYRLFFLPFTLCLVIGWYIVSRSAYYPHTAQIRSVSQIVRLLINPRTFLYGIGCISYGIYLYHFILFDFLFLKPGYVVYSVPAFIGRYAVVLGISICVALVSFFLIESPFLRRKWK